jgi:hypothetical protein
MPCQARSIEQRFDQEIMQASAGAGRYVGAAFLQQSHTVEAAVETVTGHPGRNETGTRRVAGRVPDRESGCEIREA